jgi:SHAQKYF class myb-like DNA-binding protein
MLSGGADEDDDDNIYRHPRYGNKSSRSGPFRRSTNTSAAAAAAAAEQGSEGLHDRGRRRPDPWSLEEHKLFLFVMRKRGRGNWREISADMQNRRTPAQVASHAQKLDNFQARRKKKAVDPESVFMAELRESDTEERLLGELEKYGADKRQGVRRAPRA